MSVSTSPLPLAGVRVVERSGGVAAAYAGRLLAAMGAHVVMAEPPGGAALRREPPLLAAAQGLSAVFAYLAAGKHSLICDLDREDGMDAFDALLEDADILIDDTPLAERGRLGLDPASLDARHPRLVHVSVLPFGAEGDKSEWRGAEVNTIHAAGEGFLLPNGLSRERFPNRPPLKIYGHFASYQGGADAALMALAGLWMRGDGDGQFIDVAIQDAAIMVGAFAIQRLGDGSLEHRSTRNFRYGGVFQANDGYLEFLMLEDRQWQGLVALMEHPAWAEAPWLSDPLERSRRGDEINAFIREWVRSRSCERIVRRAQELGVPVAKYRTPPEILAGEHETARTLFVPLTLPDGARARALFAPFHFLLTPLQVQMAVPVLDEWRCSGEYAATMSGRTLI